MISQEIYSKLRSKEQVGLFSSQDIPTPGPAANMKNVLTSPESTLIEAEAYSSSVFFW
jgi:hypothetical protein